MATHPIRTRVPDTLTARDIHVLVKNLRSFLETCRLTPDAKTYLKFNPDFAQVIEKL
jgi:hypothetical protein